MRLSDLMSGADLVFYPLVAMFLFLIAFLAVTARLFVRPKNAGDNITHELDHAANLPLADDSAPFNTFSHASPMEGDHRVHR